MGHVAGVFGRWRLFGCAVAAFGVLVVPAVPVVQAGSLPTSAGSSSPVAADRADWEQEVLRLTNLARAKARKCGKKKFPAVAGVRPNNTLARAARKHSADMGKKGYFSHTSRSGATMVERTTREGYTYSWLGENIAAGQRTPKEVVNAWLGSPGHCENVMNGHFTELGVGYAYTSKGKYHHYWTQDFGRPA